MNDRFIQRNPKVVIILQQRWRRDISPFSATALLRPNICVALPLTNSLPKQVIAVFSYVALCCHRESHIES